MGLVDNATSRPALPLKRPGIHCTGEWVGARAGLDERRKFRLHRGFETQTAEAVSSRYTGQLKLIVCIDTVYRRASQGYWLLCWYQ
jgi:hypothetical protein